MDTHWEDSEHARDTPRTHAHMLSTPATHTPVTKCNPETALPQTPGTVTHTLKQLMCKKYKTLPGNTFLTDP